MHKNEYCALLYQYVAFCIKRKGRQLTALYYFSVTFNTSSLIAARARSRAFVL